jgi:hypothetical protein
MDFNLEHIIYLNLYSKPDSFHQFEKIAEFFHFNFSSIQKALDLNYSYVYIDVRNSEIIGCRYENEIECFLENYEGDEALNEVLLFDHNGLNEIYTTNFNEVVFIDLSNLSDIDIELLSIRFYFKRLFWLKLKTEKVKKIWWNFNIRQIVALEFENTDEFSLTDYFSYFDAVLIEKLKSIQTYSILNDFNWLTQEIVKVKSYNEKIDFLRNREIPSLKILDELRAVAIKNDFFELAIPLQKIIKNVDSVKSSRYKTIVDSNFIFNKL